MKLPHLHLRDLFWLAALVAMGCGWWVDRSRFRQELYNLKQIASEMGRYAHDRYGMEGGYSEHSGYLYIDGKRIWSTNDSRFPKEEPDNWP